MQIKIPAEQLEEAIAKDATVKRYKALIEGWQAREKERYHSYDPMIAEVSEKLKEVNRQKENLKAQANTLRNKIARYIKVRAYRRAPLLAYERKIQEHIREVKRKLVLDVLRMNRYALEEELDKHELDLTGKVAKKGEHFKTIEHTWAPGRPKGRPKGTGKKITSPAPAGVDPGGNSEVSQPGTTPAPAKPDSGATENAMASASLADKVAEHSFGGGYDNLNVDAANAAKLAAGGDPAKTD